MKKVCLFCAAALGMATTASAAPIITLGNYSIAVGQTQSVSINVSDSATPSIEDIEGMDFKLQIASGTGAAPSIDSIDLLSGTVFAGNVSPSNIITPTGGNLPQFMLRSFDTESAGDFVNANGLLATAVIDARAATPGVYGFELTSAKDAGSDTQFFNGNGASVPGVFANGTITVTAVPEPTGAALLLLGGFALRRRNKSLLA